MTAQLAKLGVGPEQIKQAASSLDIGKLAGLIGGLLGSVAGLATNFVFLIELLLFLGVESSGMPERMAEIDGEAHGRGGAGEVRLWHPPVLAVSIIQPRFIGDAVGLSTTLTFVALVFWAWLLGGLGAILAIPMTLLIKALLIDTDPKAAWANALMRSLEKVPDPNKPPKVKKSRWHKLEPAPEPPAAI